jgi:murein DD-endopeptidase MepM/ murein hydrolase activator NlpD
MHQKRRALRTTLTALLTTLLVGLGLSLTAPVATAREAAEPGTLAKPVFLAPFECGQRWTYSTYPGHGNVLDFVRADGGETKGSRLLASAAGTATRHNQPGGAGQYIRIDHGDGWMTEYMHLDTYGVPDGARVEQGDVIGTVGETGNTSGPHLHLQHKLNGELQDIELEGRSLAPYPPEYNMEFITSTNGCGNEPPDPPEPPVQKDTALAYSGATSIANGSPAELAATLTEKEGGAPVTGREVTLTLGAEGSAQTCKAQTGADGKAACSIPSVNQPLNAAATVPVKAAFAGDEGFKASEATAEVKLQYVTGRAYGLSAEVPILLVPISLDPTPDTGAVRTAGAGTVAPDCTQNIDAVVLSADVLCAKVTTTVGPGSATSTATLQEATVGLPGLPVIEASGLTASSTSTCATKEGSTKLTLTIAGTPVTVPDTPNHTIDLGIGAKLVTNEQTETADGLTVTALHLTAPGGIDVTLASSTSAAHNCA